MASAVNYSGFVVAGIGFFLTRFTVTLAIFDDPMRFYLAGVVPLALGLGLAAFGVALAVADVDAAVVRTTALWCVFGFLTMLVLVALTLFGSTAGNPTDLQTVRSQTYLSNFLIGGSVGGTLTGLYAARNHRQQSELQQQTNRLVVLNRLLRHEILNAVAVIRGHAAIQNEDSDQAQAVIERRSETIEETIEEVKYLTRHGGQGPRAGGAVGLRDAVRESVETVSEQHPDADPTIEDVPDSLQVRANDRLSEVFTILLDNAVRHGDTENPTVTVRAERDRVFVDVSDTGPGLPVQQQALLETGQIDEYDDPTTGFGLNIVRLLVESYGGDIETDVDSAGTTITLELPRADTADPTVGPTQAELTGVRPAIPHLVVAFAAAIVAGVFYGLVSIALGGSVAGIGVFYGAPDPVIGWLTHEFHSVVFGFVFVSLVSLVPDRYPDSVGVYVAVGVAWALVLWMVAAGVVAPVWLRLLGIPAPLPSLSGRLLATHVVWGVSLGVLTAWGYRYVTPKLAALGDRLGDRSILPG